MEKLNNEKIDGQELDQKLKETFRFYKDNVLPIITEIQRKINKGYGTRYIDIMKMLFDLPANDIAMKDDEMNKLSLSITEQNGNIYYSIPIFTEDGHFYGNIGKKNYEYLTTRCKFDSDDFEGFAIRAWEYIFNNTPIPTQQLYNEYKEGFQKNENYAKAKGMSETDAKAKWMSEIDAKAKWMSETVTTLIKNMRKVRNRVLCCKHFLCKNRMYKQKNKNQLKKQKKILKKNEEILKKETEIKEQRNKALNQLLGKNNKKIEQECKSNYFRNWKGNVKKYKRTELLNKLLASKIKVDEQTKQEKKARDEKQQLAKTFYTFKYNGIIQKQQEEINEKQNKLKTRALKGLVKQKIDDEKNIMSKTFHNWKETAKCATLNEENTRLKTRIDNLKKGYVLVNDANNKHKEELKKEVADVKQELEQLTKTNEKTIESLKIRHEKEKKDIIEKLNKDMHTIFNNESKKISKYVNDELIPNYNYYKNRYWEKCNDNRTLANTYNDLLNEYFEKYNENIKLEDTCNGLLDKINTSQEQAKRYFELYYKQKGINEELKQQLRNQSSNNLLNTMSYFYQTKGFGKGKK